MLTPADTQWLDLCSLYQRGELSHPAILAAVSKALKNTAYHIDPYELLVDAGICDAGFKPISG